MLLTTPTDVGGVQAAPHHLFRLYPALALGDFRTLWLGTLPSTLAWHMHVVAVGYVAFQLTGTATALGLVTFAVGIPMLLFALVGGVVADRAPRRRVIIVTQSAHLINTAVLATLAVTGLLVFWHLLVSGVVAGVAFAFSMPARQAYLADLAGAHKRNAVALNSAGLNGMRIIGPAIAGGLLSVPFLGAGGVFAVMACLYGAVLVTLFRLPDPPVGPDLEAGSPGWLRMLDGLRYVRSSPTLLALMGLAIVPLLFGVPFQSLLPLFAEKVFAAGPAGLGTLYSALGLGALVGSVFAAGLARASRTALLQLALGVAFGLALTAFAAAPSHLAALPLLFVVGLTSAAYAALNGTMVVGNADPRLYGRVMSVYFIGHSVIPIGALPMALVADAIGGPATVALAGMVVAATVASVAVLYPPYRRIR